MAVHGKRASYTAVSLSKELLQEVDKCIRKLPNYEYRSRAEFVKEAIRCHLNKIQRRYK